LTWARATAEVARSRVSSRVAPTKSVPVAAVGTETVALNAPRELPAAIGIRPSQAQVRLAPFDAGEHDQSVLKGPGLRKAALPGTATVRIGS
jgi:hypothetical protein